MKMALLAVLAAMLVIPWVASIYWTNILISFLLYVVLGSPLVPDALQRIGSPGGPSSRQTRQESKGYNTNHLLQHTHLTAPLHQYCSHTSV